MLAAATGSLTAGAVAAAPATIFLKKKFKKFAFRIA